MVSGPLWPKQEEKHFGKNQISIIVFELVDARLRFPSAINPMMTKLSNKNRLVDLVNHKAGTLADKRPKIINNGIHYFSKERRYQTPIINAQPQ